ncbi:TPM domain-containing protein [Microbacterium pumilum]|uniref:TPM domain-containing protein n=1 Tax=Microbacterium pumilum TaxID=344165 RepID=A0ABP5DSQ4_9MICO
MRARWAVALTAVLVAVVVSAGGAAWATDPVELGVGHVVDQVEALDPTETAAAEDRLTQLYESTGTDLYVVFVDEFTNPENSQQWADTVAQLGGLGPSQYLLAVATESRQYYLSADSSGPMSEQSLTAVEAATKPFLTDGDYAGAVDAAADTFESELNDSGGGSGGVGGFPTGVIVLIIVVAAIALVVWLIIRSRRKKAATGGAGGAPQVEQIDTAELERRASSALVDTDDAVKTSTQELGFAKAQFGDAATVEFEKALADAQENLTQAFTLKQQLDDATPDAENETRAWNARIIELCEQANAWLDDKAAAFDELRKLEQNAPEALARVQGERQQAAAALDGAAARLQALSAQYAPETLAMIADNPEQARQRIAFADEQLTAAQTAIGQGKGGEAAVGIRAAEESVAQAVLLEGAIDKLATDLAAGESNAAALIAELEQDVTVAGTLPDTDGRVAAAIAATRQQIDAARANLASGAKRPLVTLQALEAANQQIDAVVAGVRDAEAQAQRARQMVGQLIMQAQAQVSAAEDYITARRGAVGAEARTRLAEAGAALVRAQQLQQNDPQQAMQQAQRADQLAGAAIQLAQTDVGAFGGAGGGMGGMFGGGQSSGGGGGMLGAVLGGIVINSMLGGGGGRSSGGLGGMFGGGSSGGRSGPGSFGGGGTRGRRGGGRF